MEKKADLSDLECDIVFDARWAGVNISGTVVLLVFSHTQLCENLSTER